MRFVMRNPKDKKNNNEHPEQEAVRTTIVGGRPPGSGKDLGEVPKGIEILVKKASVDATFKDALLKLRSKAAELIELTLETSEEMMLNTIPQKLLEGIISKTKVHSKIKKAFLGSTAAVMLAALTAADASGGTGTLVTGIKPDDPRYSPQENSQNKYQPKSWGIQPDDPKEQSQPWHGPTKGIRPDDYVIPVYVNPEVRTLGIRPDREAAERLRSELEAHESVSRKEEYLNISPDDVYLSKGTIKVYTRDKYSGQVISDVKVTFEKKGISLKGQQKTEGLGYTTDNGLYMNPGIPFGKYVFFAEKETEDSPYKKSYKNIDVKASGVTVITFFLSNRKYDATRGTRAH